MANENLEESPELPNTAPIVEEEIETEKSKSYWGKLIQLTNNGHSTRVLTDEVYHAGRAQSCELAISEKDLEPRKYNLISKVHFKIVKSVVENEEIVYLEDLSSNGTFVNEKKVERNQKVLLQSSAEIALASPNMKMYLYIHSSNGCNDQWLHKSLSSQFYILKQLGAGNFGDVRLALDQRTYEKFALKKILKQKMPEAKIFNEINILKRLKHPCIVQLEGIFDTPEAVYITLEYISGGNLLNRIVKFKKIPEFQSKIIFYQLLLGVDYLHKEGITHRDLKPENILIDVDTKSNDVLIKITDFGLSKISTTESNLKTICGTMKYIAPEVLAHHKSSYDNKVDIWSLGVILFVCLSGQLPFMNEDNTNELAKEIMSGRYKMKTSVWQFISKQAVHIVKRILVVDPLMRISIPELLEHPWINDDEMKNRVNNMISEKSVEDLEPVLKRQKLCI